MMDKSFPDQQKGTVGGTFNVIKPTKIISFSLVEESLQA